MYGEYGITVLGTGATQSIATYELDQVPKLRKAKFYEEDVTMTLADGVTKQEWVLVTSITDSSKLDRIPDVSRNRTLLVVDFIWHTGIMLNLKEKRLQFALLWAGYRFQEGAWSLTDDGQRLKIRAWKGYKTK